MKHFFLILTHYLKRCINDAFALIILLAVPIGMIAFNSVIGDAPMYNGYNINASFVSPAMLVGFQFFNSAYILEFLYKDFRGSMRWRLNAAPCTLRTFIVPAFIANWLFSMLFGVITIIVSSVAFNAYWGNLWVVAAVLVLVSLMSVIVGMLLFLFTKKMSIANGLVYAISFGMMLLSGMLFIPLGDSAIATFFMTYGTPLALGARAIAMSGSMPGLLEMANFDLDMTQSLINIGILAGATLVLGLIALIAAKRRRTF